MLNDAPFDHGGRRRPTAAMSSPPRRRDIPQAAHTVRYKSMSLKLKNTIIYHSSHDAWVVR